MDALCCRTKSEEFQKYTGSPRSQHMGQSRRVPQDAVVYELHKVSLPDDVYSVLGRSRFRTEGDH